MSMTKKSEKKSEEAERFDSKGFWKKLWILIEPTHSAIYKLLILMFLLEISKLTGPYFLKLIIDSVTRFDAQMLNHILLLIFFLFASNQISSFINYLSDTKIFDLLVQLYGYLYRLAHRRLLFLKLSYHEKENTGNKVFKVTRGIDKLDELFVSLCWEIAPSILQNIFTAAVLFWVDWRFGMVLVFCAPVFILLTLKINKDVYPYRKKRFSVEEDIAGVMTQAIININTVKSFVQEWREYRRMEKILNNYKIQILTEFGKILRFNLIRNAAVDIARVLMLILGVYLIYKGQITIGSLVFVYTISEKALISLYRINRLYDRVMESSEAITRLYDISQEEGEDKESKGIKPEQINGEIEFKNVDFTYNESGQKALEKVSFKINSGCVTAFVGPSGGGKTTVARMIYRHYDPQSGEILIDKKNAGDYNLFSLRKFIAIVPQDVEVFNSSVKENISYAKPGATQTEIKAAARIANADEFISQLKEGYNTLVGERGIKLSGGQRQRIGIARAILANPRILIFDEATSNLDSYSEKLIQDAMDKIRKNRTVIIIAHRLSTIKKADKIIVLEKGKVVEEGSHFELAKTDGGLYQKLIGLQKVGDVE